MTDITPAVLTKLGFSQAQLDAAMAPEPDRPATTPELLAQCRIHLSNILDTPSGQTGNILTIVLELLDKLLTVVEGNHPKAPGQAGPRLAEPDPRYKYPPPPPGYGDDTRYKDQPPPTGYGDDTRYKYPAPVPVQGSGAGTVYKDPALPAPAPGDGAGTVYKVPAPIPDPVPPKQPDGWPPPAAGDD